jgi:hypothetical protein
VKYIAEAETNFYRMRQGQHESIHEFYDRFLNQVNSARAIGVRFEDYVERARNQTDEDYNKKVEAAREKKLAMLFLHKLDLRRYGNLIVDLENAMALNRDEYPKTVNDAFLLASNRREHFGERRMLGADAKAVAFATNASYGQSKKQGSDNKQQQGKKQRGKDDDHVPQVAEPKNNSGKRCYLCKELGHIQTEVDKCPVVKKVLKMAEKQKADARNEAGAMAAIEDAAAYCVTVEELKEEQREEVHEEVQGAAADEVVREEVREEDATAEIVLPTHSNVQLGPRDILCDNASTVNIFKQADLLKNLRDAATPLRITGVSKGSFIATKIGEVWLEGEYVCDAYFHENSLTNILCFRDLADMHTVKYINNTFVVTLKNSKKQITFKPKGKLYVYTAGGDDGYVLVNTVAGNEQLYTKREIEAAQQARELRRKLGYPSVADMSRMITTGGILNCPITVQDLQRAVNIYGQELAVLKGSTVRRAPEPVKIELLEDKPKELTLLTVAMDLMFIAGLVFLLTISRRLNLIMVRYVSCHHGRYSWAGRLTSIAT